ncbi:hypothetical protein PanWU01x14_310360, partial [Parasponia andersonii]
LYYNKSEFPTSLPYTQVRSITAVKYFVYSGTNPSSVHEFWFFSTVLHFDISQKSDFEDRRSSSIGLESLICVGRSRTGW